MAEKRMDPVEAILSGAMSGIRLAVATVAAEVRLPLLDRVQELEAELTAALARAEKAEAEREEFRRRLQE